MNTKCPALAVDVICVHLPSRRIAMIERKYPPLGYALPGGFVDEGESVEDAARREMKEELNVKLHTLQLLGVYSKPDRDPRRHVVSVAFVAMITDAPVAGDDAKTVQLLSIEHLLSQNLCFDHNTILMDALVRNLL